MPISFIPDYYHYSDRRCSDPNLYSLRNTPNERTPSSNSNIVYLPPLLANANRNVFERHHQFSDTSCQERSIMIDKLIEASADIIDSIWTSHALYRPPNIKVMSTSCFIREILKRSRATYSMLQLALFYIFRIKRLVCERMQQPHPFFQSHDKFAFCGRRIFLASLMIASKYLNDKNYRNKTWAKIASLPIAEINITEFVFLKLINYQLYVSKPLYDKWISLLHVYIQRKNNVYPLTKPYSLRNEDEFCYSVLRDNNSSPTLSSPTVSLTSSSSSSEETISSYTPCSEMSNTPPLSYGSKRSCSFSVADGIAVKHLRQC
ncbi:MAG: hypothetical protein EXX96DRAFT_560479 [Benjaminiella poitrasii]|nr:MAG: hypothetical protein EXX96DRAFT_560479 [Benjaminiella poitrasii]